VADRAPPRGADRPSRTLYAGGMLRTPDAVDLAGLYAPARYSEPAT